jgi:hypothetical protein
VIADALRRQSTALSLRRNCRTSDGIADFTGDSDWSDDPWRRPEVGAKAKPMNSVQIAEALLEFEGAPRLVALLGSGRKCDAVPVEFAMLRMFPDSRYEDLAEGLQLALDIARLDIAEVEAAGGLALRH